MILNLLLPLQRQPLQIIISSILVYLLRIPETQKWAVSVLNPMLSDFHGYVILKMENMQLDLKREWEIALTYSQCVKLQHDLEELCPNIPGFEEAKLFGMKTSSEDIVKTQVHLQKWLYALLWRSDVLSTKRFQEFCNLTPYFYEQGWLEQPKPLFSIETKFELVDFHFEEQDSILFVLTSASNDIESKLESVLSLFEKKKKSELAALEIHESEARVLWTESFELRATKLAWNKELTILGVGFQNGSVTCIRVESEKHYGSHYEFGRMRKHTSAVLGMVINPLTGYMYSIAKDNCLISTDLGDYDGNFKEKAFKTKLTLMLDDRINYRFFLGDKDGNLYMLGYQTQSLQALHQIKEEGSIEALKYYNDQELLLVGLCTSDIMVYRLRQLGKERLCSLVSKISTGVRISMMALNRCEKHLYLNYNGSVVVMDSQKVKYLYSLKAHEQHISKMELYEAKAMLVTGGKDKQVRIWNCKEWGAYSLKDKIRKIRQAEQFEQAKKAKKQELQSQIHNPELEMKQQIEDLDHWNH